MGMLKKIKGVLKSKRILMTPKEDLIGKTSKETEFLVCDGRRLGDLLELVDALDNMNNDIFVYHVNDFRNDFSNWIRDVMKKDELADGLSAAKSKDQAQIIVLRYLVKKALK